MRLIRRFAAAALSALLLASSGSLAAAETSTAAAADVERLERELVAAIAKTDLAAYDRIVADDYVVFDASGREITKAEVMKSYRDGSRKYTNLEIYDVHGRVFGDAAVVSARTRGLRRENGQDVPNLVRYVRVYSRRGGTWRAVSQMSAPLAN